MKLTEDIRPVTDLKRHTREILDHVHATGRPVILTVNGRADFVIMDAEVYQKHLQSVNMARLLAPAEADVAEGRTRPADEFFEEFIRSHNIRD